MTRLHEVIETRLPIDDAFAFVADFANASAWDPGIHSSERIGSGPVGVGARFRLGVALGGRTVPMEYAITAHEAPRLVVLTGTGSGIRAVDEIRFEPTPAGGTRVDYTADITFGGILRLAQPFLGGALDKTAKAALAGMRRALDERADTLPSRVAAG